MMGKIGGGDGSTRNKHQKNAVIHLSLNFSDVDFPASIRAAESDAAEVASRGGWFLVPQLPTGCGRRRWCPQPRC